MHGCLYHQNMTTCRNNRVHWVQSWGNDGADIHDRAPQQHLNRTATSTGNRNLGIFSNMGEGADKDMAEDMVAAMQLPWSEIRILLEVNSSAVRGAEVSTTRPENVQWDGPMGQVPRDCAKRCNASSAIRLATLHQNAREILACGKRCQCQSIPQESKKTRCILTRAVYCHLSTSTWMTHVLVDRRQYTALVNTGYPKTVKSKWLCCQWRCQNIKVLTADGKILICHGTSQVELVLGCMNPLHLEILVVEGNLLGFDLLLGSDNIKNLMRVHLNILDEIHFLAENLPGCDMIKIDEPNFSAIFNQ